MVRHKTISIMRRQLIKKKKKKKKKKKMRTLASSSPSLPTLPFHLIPEILSRLPVKFLLQLRCVCKSWKFLISDPKFAKKHLSLSTTLTVHCISYSRNAHVLLKSYSLDFGLTNIMQTQFPSFDSNVFFVGSCDGILCFVNSIIESTVLQLWNPSIRKFKELPPFVSEPQNFPFMYGFGYDPTSDNYKIVVVFSDLAHEDLSEDEVTDEVMDVKVHTLGTDSWKNVSKFPFPIISIERRSGQHVSGTINWLVFMGIKRLIASYDLRNECHKEFLLPDDSGKVEKNKLSLTVFRDCLCMISGEDVWIMKEYGNKESWTKLFTISYMRDACALPYSYIKAICIFEDEQVLLIYRDDERRGYISYNYKNDTSKFLEFENTPFTSGPIHLRIRSLR